MAGDALPKQRRGQTLVPPAPKAGVARRGLEPNKKKVGSGLADLREEDKTKVARLINQVILAFREIQCLKELLEGERSSHESLVANLQQQNHEVASEFLAHLRLKLASMQLMSPLLHDKVSLQAGRPPCLSPIREAEGSEAESEATPSLAAASDTEIKGILRGRGNLRIAFTTSGEKFVIRKSEGLEQPEESENVGGCETSYDQSNQLESRGKENKDPEFNPHLTGECVRTASQEETAGRPKRPPPRPLPDLLSNILHRPKVVEYADQSKSPIKCLSNPSTSSSSNPIVQGHLNSEASLSLPQGVQSSCNSLSLKSIKQFSNNATTVSQGLLDPATSMSGDPLTCPVHGKCSQAGLLNPLPISHQSQASNPMDAAGQGCTARPEAAGQDFNFNSHADCSYYVVHKCPPICQQSHSCNFGNLNYKEQLERSKTIQHEMSTLENLKGAQKDGSLIKLRFDPSVGEEGAFYYALDVENHGNGNLDGGSLHPSVAGDGGGEKVEERTEKVSSSMSTMEEERLNRNTLKSHWTPEAIERRNSFHRIPDFSPRSTKDNGRCADGQKWLGYELVGNGGSMEQETGGDLSSTDENEQPSESKSEVNFRKTEKLYLPKLRQSSQRARKCIKCSSTVQCKSRRPKAKYLPNCSKWSSVVEPDSSVQRPQETRRCGRHVTRPQEAIRCEGKVTRCDRCSSLIKAKAGKHKGRNCVQTSGCSTEDENNVSHSSIYSSSSNMARCVKCAAPFKPKLFRSLPKMRRGGQRRIKSVSVDEERPKPANVGYCVTGDDLHITTNSSTDSMRVEGRYSSSFPVKLCRIHTRKTRNNRGHGREITSTELELDQKSKQTKEAFHVNHEILDVLQSDGECAGQPKSPLADPANCRVQSQRFGKSCRSSHHVIAKGSVEQGSEPNSTNFALKRLLDADLDVIRKLFPSCGSSQRAGKGNNWQRKHRSQSQWTFEVDDLIDRFIQSNAECAAELIKCSVYFDSTVSMSSSQFSHVTEKGVEGCISSLPPSQTTLVNKIGTQSCIVSSERAFPRRELFHLDHNCLNSEQPYQKDPVRCCKCSVILNSRKVVPLVGTRDSVEGKGRCHKDLCVLCFASETAEKKTMKRSADHVPQGSMQSLNAAPPIVLPKVKNNDPLKIIEAGSKGLVVSPSSFEILVHDEKKSGDSASKRLCGHPDNPSDNQLMPLVTQVLVSSQRSTSPRETEQAETVHGLAEMFDMSLYDLVNDVEGQRRDYWRKLNSQSVDEGPRTRNQDNNSRRIRVEVDTVQKASITRRFLPREQGTARHFR